MQNDPADSVSSIFKASPELADRPDEVLEEREMGALLGLGAHADREL